MLVFEIAVLELKCDSVMSDGEVMMKNEVGGGWCLRFQISGPVCIMGDQFFWSQIFELQIIYVKCFELSVIYVIIHFCE